MNGMIFLFICFLAFARVSFGHIVESRPRKPDFSTTDADFSFPQSQVSPATQEESVKGLLQRLIPDKQDAFLISVNPKMFSGDKDVFRISSPFSHNDTRVGIFGSSGVAAAWGLMHYLKYYCNAHVSWEAYQLDLPNPLPQAQVKITANDRFRYYQNVCTSSYSFVWWSWEQWETHVDWMALNGINFPLAFTGQEAIWYKVYKQMNFTDEDLEEFFAGPGFLAWGRMGNLKAWGGPISNGWNERTLKLQKRILHRMRSFGMTPILPAFSGFVPDAISRLYPNAKTRRLGYWSKFTDPKLTRTLVLDPRDPLFPEIGKNFILTMREEYNYTDHYYNCDTFNEMAPPTRNPEYIRSIGKSIYKAMTAADKNAIWVMQGWLFRSAYWNKPLARSLLRSVPLGKMIVLDLMADTYPQYKRFNSFYGQPFIFCLLHNFGGVDGLFGNVEMLVQQLAAARSYENVTIVGTGMTPEGINQNYVMYDLMTEFGWRKPTLNITKWAEDYSLRRYGNYSQHLLQEAWRLLITSIYNDTDPYSFHGKSDLLSKRPNIRSKLELWYDVFDVISAWNLMIQASQECPGNCSQDPVTTLDLTKSNAMNGSIAEHNTTEWEKDLKCLNCQKTFRHDIVDVTRQVLQILGSGYIQDIRKAYHEGNIDNVKVAGLSLMAVFDDMERILLSSKDFLLGAWLDEAKKAASNEKEEEQFAKNVLHQLTLWGPNGEILDYAAKQWSGLVEFYKKPRWMMFLQDLTQAMVQQKSFDQELFNLNVFDMVEKPFALNISRLYPTEPQGNPIDIANEIHKKYSGQLEILLPGRKNGEK